MKKSQRYQSEIIDVLFCNRNINELNQYLTDHSEIDLINLLDSQGNTVLHQLAYEGHLDIIQLFVKKVGGSLHRQQAILSERLYERMESQQITNWMNKTNNQDFTPLLYACYSGHLDVIRYLVEEHHVNQRLVTKSGLNVLHLAAQKNMIGPFLYFRGVLGLQEEDILKSTPLHWAAYLNCEQVVAYILSETVATINLKDNDGNTPLMVAVIYGNTRIVRRLLMKGANRYIKNKEDKMALDIARQNNFNVIGKMLNQKFSILDLLKFYCNVKIEYKPTGRKFTLPAIFIISVIINVAILNFLIKFTQDYSYYVQGGSMVPMMFMYFTLLCGPNPPDTLDYKDVLNSKTQKRLKKMCFECKNSMPKRGYHCDICGVCTKQYDHHCTWINNCVGKRNIARFIFFLVFLILSLTFIGLVSFLASVSIIIDKQDIYSEWFTLRYAQMTALDQIATVIMLAVNFVSSLFVFPVVMLLIVQLRNLLKNQTTYEMIRNRPSQQNAIKDKMRRYNNKVSPRNCKVMCNDNSSSVTSRSSICGQQPIIANYDRVTRDLEQ